MARILLIDDDPLFLEWLAMALTAEDHTVETAASGEEALRSLEKHLPDIVISDIVMPQIDGYALKALIDRRYKVPVVFISVINTAGEALLQGAAGFLHKPFIPKLLVEEIRGVLKPGGPEEILLVDDDLGMLDLLEMVLGSAGFRIRKAINGREGLTMLEQYPDIGLVITDVNMPVMSGMEFVKSLRAESRWANLPVMIQTSDQLMARPNVWSELHIEKSMEKSRFVSWLVNIIDLRLKNSK